MWVWYFTVWVAVCGSAVHNQAQDWDHYWRAPAVHTGPVPVCSGGFPGSTAGSLSPYGTGY